MKIDYPELRGLPQELIDWADKVTELINYGKFQKQSVSTAPTWSAKVGEEVFYKSDTTGRIYINTGTSSWAVIAEFAV